LGEPELHKKAVNRLHCFLYVFTCLLLVLVFDSLLGKPVPEEGLEAHREICDQKVDNDSLEVLNDEGEYVWGHSRLNYNSRSNDQYANGGVYGVV